MMRKSAIVLSMAGFVISAIGFVLALVFVEAWPLAVLVVGLLFIDGGGRLYNRWLEEGRK